MPYALFDRDRRIGESASTELDVWKAALRAGLVSDLPVADEQGGQVLPHGLHVKRVDEDFAQRPESPDRNFVKPVLEGGRNPA